MFILILKEYFDTGPSGGQFSCPGKKIDKKPAQGALPKSRPR